MTITAKEAAKQRAQLRRELERDLKKKDRAKLQHLRDQIKAARAWRKGRLREIADSCRRARELNRERAKELRAQARMQLNAEIQRQRERSRTKCERRKKAARTKAKTAIDRVTKALQEEAQHQRVMQIHTRPSGARRASKAELKAESDVEVMNNIPAELAPAFRRVRKKIRASPRRTRTEAFLEWARENRGDVQRIIDAEIERDVAKLVKAEAELRKQVARPSRYARMPESALLRKYDSYQGAPEVPF